MCIDIRGIRVRLCFAAAAVIACLLNSAPKTLLAAGAAGILLHELTHLLLMRAYGCRRSLVEILPGGVRIVSEDFDALGYRQSALCLLGAPAVNLLLGAVLWAAGCSVRSEALRYAAVGNLLLGAVNLLPMPFLDGGRALEYLLRCRKGAPDAGAAVQKAGVCCLLLMAVSAIVLGLYKIYPVGFYLFFGYCLVTQASGTVKKTY